MTFGIIEVELHGFGIGLRQRERGAGAARRTDGAEQIGIFVALVGRLSRSRPTSGPLPDDAILLADPGFILEPDFDRGPLGHVRQMHTQRAREVFLKASMISTSCLG